MIAKESRNSVRVRRHLRVREKVHGTSSKPRLCVFRSNKHIEAQIIDDEKGITLASSSSTQLKLANGGNCEAAAKVGEDLAKKALAKGIEEVVFDRGGYIYHGRVAALAEAARENGLKF
ncbi:MAG TPA: 50S ribosomal protein L18 [Candidatus Enteromonas pullicola]|uniref:Large ribosomal subunit protein uL18 n=1 Tax=Candidatus Alloenteromonas pullicola TaxID=2840784 RepID=A0A9D1LND0_9FIRM|nr:50S ribosomal protein L18 [Candidatus Enteromonas pullicola]